jgi:hypothetical protein
VAISLQPPTPPIDGMLNRVHHHHYQRYYAIFPLHKSRMPGKLTLWLPRCELSQNTDNEALRSASAAGQSYGPRRSLGIMFSVLISLAAPSSARCPM